jgi:hypothetical protein
VGPVQTANLKNKGAVMGTSIRDLCELVGGMASEDEVRLVAVDGWSTRFAYQNIYEPLDRQGTIVLCWYKGPGPVSGDIYGAGYPGVEGYNEAIQVVFMSGMRIQMAATSSATMICAAVCRRKTISISTRGCPAPAASLGSGLPVSRSCRRKRRHRWALSFRITRTLALPTDVPTPWSP